MASGKPPRHSKASSEPVTIDLEAERTDANRPDETPHAEGMTDGEATLAELEVTTEAGADEQGADTTAAEELATGDPTEDTPQRRATSSAQATPERRGPSTSAMVAAGIFGGLVALAGAGSMQYAGYLPSVGATPAATTPAADPALAAKLTALEERVASLSQVPAAATTDPALETRLAAAEAALAELRAQAGTAADEAALAALRQELATFGEAMNQLKAETSANSQTLNDTGARLAEAEKKIEEPRSDVELARTIAITALKAAIDHGGPYLAELDTLAGIAPDDASLAGLKTHAATGVLSRAELVRRFPDVATAILTAVNQPAEGDGIGARLLSSAFSVIKVRPVGNVEGDTPEAIVARMEDKLRNGDLKGAEIEWQSLPDAGKAASNEFAALLKARLEVETLIDAAMATAVRNKA